MTASQMYIFRASDSRMTEVFVKCEVMDCRFLTPQLPPEFYGDMVEHLKVIGFLYFWFA